MRVTKLETYIHAYLSKEEMISILYLALTIGFSIFVWIWLKRKRNFWKNFGVHTPPYSLIWGHFRTRYFQGGSPSQRVRIIYDYVREKGLKYAGLYLLLDPWFVVVDLDLIKHILQSDFQHFTDKIFDEVEGEPLTGHLLCLKGQRWKLMRKKLTPAFSSGKMKMMFETFLACTYTLREVMDQELSSPEIDIKDILGRFSTDLIGSCAFGIKCNSLKEPHNEFREMGKRSIQIPTRMISSIKQKLISISPGLMRMFNVRVIPQDAHDFFMDVVQNTIEYREKYNVTRKDLMQILIDLKNRKKLVDDDEMMDEVITEEENTISINEIAAQAYVFFVGGFETSATVMTFCLYELAKNPSIQDKVRQEILEVLKRHDGNLTYDTIMEMPYLEKVIFETIRKFPPSTVSARTCTKDYKVPETEIILTKGMNIWIPTFGIHHDPKYYPDPEKFDPERFSEENKKLRHDFSFLGFGEGPRMCIGKRLGLMKTKLGLTTLLRNYEFSLSNRTKEPFQWDPDTPVLSVVGNIWLKHKK
ncbi:hypothetical protein WA026_005667 [Henosepilachna vigintioctopunctata]|uniref:Cytochrome P450 n=1 Tax=Henosepilachna vigintioctopunctata TaxID=420089 RepID=A0AAW1U2S6_9CUCU